MDLQEAYTRWKAQQDANNYRLSPEVDQTIGAASGINPGIIQAGVPQQTTPSFEVIPKVQTYQPPKPDSTLYDAASGFVQGVGRVVPDIAGQAVSGAGWLTGSKDLMQRGQDIQDLTREILPGTSDPDQSFSDMVSRAASGNPMDLINYASNEAPQILTAGIAAMVPGMAAEDAVELGAGLSGFAKTAEAANVAKAAGSLGGGVGLTALSHAAEDFRKNPAETPGVIGTTLKSVPSGLLMGVNPATALTGINAGMLKRIGIHAGIGGLTGAAQSVTDEAQRRDFENVSGMLKEPQTWENAGKAFVSTAAGGSLMAPFSEGEHAPTEQDNLSTVPVSDVAPQQNQPRPDVMPQPEPQPNQSTDMIPSGEPTREEMFSRILAAQANQKAAAENVPSGENQNLLPAPDAISEMPPSGSGPTPQPGREEMINRIRQIQQARGRIPPIIDAQGQARRMQLEGPQRGMVATQPHVDQAPITDRQRMIDRIKQLQAERNRTPQTIDTTAENRRLQLTQGEQPNDGQNEQRIPDQNREGGNASQGLPQQGGVSAENRSDGNVQENQERIGAEGGRIINSKGQQVTIDRNGVRGYVDKGIHTKQDVGINRDMSLSFESPEQLYKSGKHEFLSPREVDRFKRLAESPKPDNVKNEPVIENKINVGKPGAVDIPNLSKALVKYVAENKDRKTDNPNLKKYVADLMGVPVPDLTTEKNYSHKITQEAYESALVQYVRENKITDPEELTRLYENQPNLNERTGKSVTNQAYSTPINLSGMIADALNPKESDTVLEPTAGNGVLVSSLRVPNKNMDLNEFDLGRASLLKGAFPGANVTDDDATNGLNVKPKDLVLANPPFGSLKSPVEVSTSGSGARSFKINKLEHLIAWKALGKMKDDGKGVIIMGADKEGGLQGSDKSFFTGLYNQYNVVGHIELDGDLYSRQGAAWPISVTFVNGRRDFKSATEITPPKSVERLNTWPDVQKKIKEIGGRLNEKPAAIEEAKHVGNKLGGNPGSGSEGKNPELGIRSGISPQSPGGNSQEKNEITIKGRPVPLQESGKNVNPIEQQTLDRMNEQFQKFIQQKETERVKAEQSGEPFGFNPSGTVQYKNMIERYITDRFKPGNHVFFDENPDDPNSGRMPGVIKEINVAKSEGNPFLPSNIFIKLDTPSKTGKMMLPLSKFMEMNPEDFSGNFEKEWSEKYKENLTQRKTESFLTGDVIRATDTYSGKKEVVNLGKKDGTSIFGWHIQGEGDGSFTKPREKISLEDAPTRDKLESKDQETIRIEGNDIALRKTGVGKLLLADETLRDILKKNDQDDVFIEKKIGNKKVFKASMTEDNREEAVKRIGEILDKNGNGYYETKGESINPEKGEQSGQNSESRVATPSSRRGSTLADLAPQLAKAGFEKAVDFAKSLIKNGVSALTDWTRAMVSRFKEGIKPFLQKLWDAVAPGRQGAVSLRPSSMIDRVKEAARKKSEKIIPETAYGIGKGEGEKKIEELKGQFKEEKATLKNENKGKISELKKSRKEEMSAARARFRDEKMDLKEAHQELTDLANKHLSEKYVGKVATAISNSSTPHGYMGVVGKIEKYAGLEGRRNAFGELKSALKDTDMSALLPEQRKAMAGILSSLNGPTPDYYGVGKKVKSLLRNYQDSGIELPESVQKIVDNPVDKMKPSEVKQVTGFIRAIQTSSNMEKSETFKKAYKEISGVAKHAEEFVSKAAPEATDEETHAANKFVNMQQSPDMLADKLGEKAKPIFYEQRKEAERSALKLEQAGRDTINEAIEKAGFKPNTKEFAEWTNADRNVAGLKMNRNTFLSLLANLSDSETRREIIGFTTKNGKEIPGSGIRLGPLKSTRSVKFTEEMAKEAEKMATPQEKHIVESVKKFMNGDLKTALNKATLETMGVQPAVRSDYFPLSRDMLEEDRGKNAAFATWGKGELENAGFLKSRVKNKNPVIINDFMGTSENHIRRVSKFAGFAKNIRDAEMVLGHGTLEKTLLSKYGKNYVNNLKEQIDAIKESGHSSGGELNQAAHDLLKKVSFATLAANPRSMLKQFGGIFTMMSEMTPGDVWNGIKNTAGHLEDVRKKLWQYSPEIRQRYEGSGADILSPEFSRTGGVTEEIPWYSPKSPLRMLQLFDRINASVAWEGTEARIRKENPGMSEKAIMEKTARETERVVNRTQNATSLTDMSGVALESRKNIAWKMLTTFQSQGNKNFNILSRAYSDWKAGKISNAQAAGRMATVAIGNAIYMTAVNTAFQAAMDSLSGDDKKKHNGSWIAEKSYEVLKENLSSVYGGGNIIAPALDIIKSSMEGKPVSNSMKADTIIGRTLDQSYQSVGDTIKTLEQLYRGDMKNGLPKYRVTAVKSVDEMFRGLFPLLTGLPVFPGTVVSKLLKRGVTA